MDTSGEDDCIPSSQDTQFTADISCSILAKSRSAVCSAGSSATVSMTATTRASSNDVDTDNEVHYIPDSLEQCPQQETTNPVSSSSKQQRAPCLDVLSGVKRSASGRSSGFSASSPLTTSIALIDDDHLEDGGNRPAKRSRLSSSFNDSDLEVIGELSSASARTGGGLEHDEGHGCDDENNPARLSGGISLNVQCKNTSGAESQCQLNLVLSPSPSDDAVDRTDSSSASTQLSTQPPFFDESQLPDVSGNTQVADLIGDDSRSASETVLAELKNDSNNNDSGVKKCNDVAVGQSKIGIQQDTDCYSAGSSSDMVHHSQISLLNTRTQQDDVVPPMEPPVENDSRQLQDTVCVYSTDDSVVSLGEEPSPRAEAACSAIRSVNTPLTSPINDSRNNTGEQALVDVDINRPIAGESAALMTISNAAPVSSSPTGNISAQPLCSSPPVPHAAESSCQPSPQDDCELQLRQLMRTVLDGLRSSGYTKSAMRHMSFKFQVNGNRYAEVGFDTSFTAEGALLLHRNSSSSLSTLSGETPRLSPSTCSVGDDSSVSQSSCPPSRVQKDGSPPRHTLAPRMSVSLSGTLSTIEGRGARISVTSSLDRLPVTASRHVDERRSVMIIEEDDEDVPPVRETATAGRARHRGGSHSLSRLIRGKARSRVHPPSFPLADHVRFAGKGQPSAVSTLLDCGGGEVSMEDVQEEEVVITSDRSTSRPIHDSSAAVEVKDGALHEIAEDECSELPLPDSGSSHVTGTSSSPEVASVSLLTEGAAVVSGDGIGCLSDLEEAELSDREQRALRTRQVLPDTLCFALWSDGCYYPGRVAEAARDHRWLVLFDDGTRREVPEAHVLPVRTLWRGHSVYVSTDGNYYDTAIITGHRMTAASDSAGPILDYVVSVDSLNVTRAVSRSCLLLTRDQAADMQLLRSTAAAAAVSCLADSPARHAVTLDNVVEGRRVRRCLAGLENSASETDSTAKQIPGTPRSSTRRRCRSRVAKSPISGAGQRKSVDENVVSEAGHSATTLRTTRTRSAVAGTPRLRSCRSTDKQAESPTSSKRSRRGERVARSASVAAETAAEPVLSDSSCRQLSEDTEKSLDGTPAIAVESTSALGSSLASWSSYFPLRQFPPPSSPLFSKMAFVLTCSSSVRAGTTTETSRAFNKSHVAEYINAAGGTVLHTIDSLMSAVGCRVDGEEVCDAILLLSDRALRTEKYISCLAAGVPCVHIDWLVESARNNRRLPYSAFLLPAAEGANGGEHVPQVQPTRARCAAVLPLRSLCVGVADASDDSGNVCQWVSLMLRVTACLGAISRRVCGDPSLSEQPFLVDVLVTQPSSPTAVVRWAVDIDVPVVSGEWVIACVIHRRRLGFSERPEFQCEVDVD